ncbi:esterase/lipase [Penicillium cinerascens]|uniref:Esterase/lipase n=1 Tax=Penicillium cinerascens TaxID=70096 RepID=A0A9W9N421_9EURO|nr:esterase/lipase [Penicillium cinerascens]KAJ5212819.1 esterase/lipase [Penicillium cinerascens]
MALSYDPEWLEIAKPALDQAQAIKPAIHDVGARRAKFEGLMSRGQQSIHLPDNIEYIVHHVPVAGGHEIDIHHVRNTNVLGDDPSPVILHIHGGGYFSFQAIHSVPALAHYVSSTGVAMITINYRLAPENPFPTPLEDCWSVLMWVHHHAPELCVDRSRIAVMGESAGGGLAAGLTLLARDRGLMPKLAKHLLIYPMLDDRICSDYTGGLCFFDLDDAITGWAAYLGKDMGTDRVSPYAAPARAKTVDSLPRLYLECPQLDILLPENLRYVQMFVEAKIPTEFHLLEGLPHGFISLAPTATASKTAIETRMRAMKTI